MEQKTREIKQWKKDAVKSYAELMDSSKIIGIVNMQNLPAKQLQRMRESLRKDVKLFMARKTLLKLAFKQSKQKDIEKLIESLKGMPAILFSDENPFKLFSKLKKNKSKAPIKGGQTAPNDLVVPAGKTSFAPGPMIGELGAFGIATSVEDGKIAIQKDAVVAKEGEVVSDALASVLSRLEIEPMEIGLDLVAVWENGEILDKTILDIDEEQYLSDLKTASAWAFNLAINAGYTTKDNITFILTKAHSDAFALATEQDILTDETAKGVLAKAEAQVKALESKLDIPEVPKEEPKEETKEEKSAEAAEKTEVKKMEEERIEETTEETQEETTEVAEEVTEATEESNETEATEVVEEETKEESEDSSEEDSADDSEEKASEESDSKEE